MIAGLYERNWQNLALIALAGAVMGPLTLVGNSQFLPVFLAWQTAVSAAIGYAVARTRAVAAPVPA